MPRPPLTTDDGIFEYRASDHKKRFGLRLRIKGRLWQRQGFTTKTAAQKVRDKIRAETYEGIFFPDKYQRQRTAGVTIAACAQLVQDDYRRHQRKSQHSADGLARFWTVAAGGRRIETLDAKQLTQWADAWLRQGVTPATVNRRMTFLLRGIRLASLEGAAVTAPHWSRLTESPPRSGFLDWPTFHRIRTALPRHAQIAVTIGFWTGMRWGEIVSLRWSQVHFDSRAKTVKLSLDPLDTKTRESRIVIMPGDLYDTLVAWRRQNTQTVWVCHRGGRPLGTIDAIWKSTCVKIGLATRVPPMRQYRGPLLHDLRRSGVRNLVQAGVPEKVAMLISGHKTRSVFDRYHIVVEADLAEAGRKVVDYCRTQKYEHRMSSRVTPPRNTA